MARTKSTEPKTRKPRKPKAEAAPPASSQGSATSTFKKPPAEAVVKLVKRLANYKKDAQAISGTIGEAIAKAVETQHFDKKALGIVKGLYQMSINRPEAFAITLPHLLAYIDDLGLDQVANEARGMDLDSEDDDESEQSESPAGKPGLRIVPGAAAPGESEVPSAPTNDEAAA